MATVRVIGGLGGSDRAAVVDEIFLRHWGRARLIVPTHRAAEYRVRALILAGKIPGVWGRPICTFEAFLTELLRGTVHEGRALAPLEERLLLRRALDRVRPQGLMDELAEAAETAGFLSHLRRIIGQLKQAAVEPAAFRERVRARKHPMDALVGAVYAEYQRLLQEHGAYDTQGRFWAAHLLCSEGEPPLLRDVDAIVLDGFDDFTPSEFRLIESLAPHVAHLVVGLHYDAQPRRGDLFAMTNKLQARLIHRLNAAPEDREPPPPSTTGAYVGLHVFSRDYLTAPEGLAPNVDFYAAHTPAQELEQVARRIKQLVVEDGVALDDIAVVCRQLQTVGPKIQHLFASYGIPVRLTSGPALWESGLAATLVRLYDALGNWPRDAVVELAASPCFAGDGRTKEKLRPLYGLVARMAQVTQGRTEWRNQLRRLHRRLTSEDRKDRDAARWRKRVPLAADACAALLAELDRVEDAERALPKNATLDAHAAALLKLLDGWNVAGAIEGLGVETAAYEIENAALAAVREILHTFVAWGDEGAVSQAQFVAHLREALQQTRLPADSPEAGVAVIEMNAARHLPFAHVFLVHAVDGQLPQPPTTTALYNDRDVRDLIHCDIPLETADLAAARELVLFQRLFDMPHGQLHLSWHEMSAGGQTTRPSAFIADVRHLLRNVSEERCADPKDAAAPPIALAGKWRDLQNAAYARGYLPAATPREQMPHANLARPLAGVACETRRQSFDAHDAYDGVLSDAERIAAVAKKFDGEHTFSVNQIETWKDCPFRFFQSFVLDIPPLETPEQAFDRKVLGLILHEALEMFHKAHTGVPIQDLPKNAEEQFAGILDEVFDKFSWQSTGTPDSIAAVEKMRLQRLFRQYLHIWQEKKPEAPWEPIAFEVAFGRKRDGEDEPRPAFVLETKQGALRFSGQIDRVDQYDGKYRLIDYKSGSLAQPKDVKEGKIIQLALYCLAIEQHEDLGYAPCEAAYYVQFGRDKRREALYRQPKKGEPGWDDIRQTALNTVEEAVAGMRAGRFHPTLEDEPCRYCPKAGVCRYERSRMQRKVTAHG